MLRHLRVTNFAILSDVALELESGFNALTGETGAGKSLIVEAVNLLRGGRASANIPRTGTDEAVVEAIFDVTDLVRDAVDQQLVDAGLPSLGDELVVRRVIHRGGRSRTYINGALTTATCLATIGAFLVDLSGQHQHQGLVDAKRHRDILDTLASNGELLNEMREAHQRLARARTQLQTLQSNESSRLDRLEYLRFQLEELEAAGLQAGEETEIESERAVLAGVDKLALAAGDCEALLYSGNDSAIDRLDAAAHALERALPIDASIGECSQWVVEARALADEATRFLQNYLRRLEANPERLAELDERLALIRRLKRKHNASIEDLLQRRDELRGEVGDLEHHDERLAELAAECQTAAASAEKLAAMLGKRRKKAAQKLEDEVKPALAELGMPGAQLIVHIESLEDIGSHGRDQVEFLLAANAGELAKPLARIASGGELSRIMLALKLILRQADHVSTYVFDEVDTGIGGATAEVVGRQIRQVADQRQVLCVTHQPQIAAFADRHIHVSKLEIDGRTETRVEHLNSKQRQAELARMVGGVKVTAQARAHAKAMLEATASSRRS